MSLIIFFFYCSDFVYVNPFLRYPAAVLYCAIPMLAWIFSNEYRLTPSIENRHFKTIFSKSISFCVEVVIHPIVVWSKGSWNEYVVAAYNLYLQAMYFADHTSAENLNKAEQSLKQAIELDPNYAQAYALLADVHQQKISGFTGQSDGDFIAEYKTVHEYAQKALDLNPDLPEAHIAKGLAATMADWNSDAAVEHFSKALDLAPNHVGALGWMAVIRFVQYRVDEATVYAEKALQLDPLSITAHRDIGNAYRVAGRLDDAIEAYRDALRLQPNAARIHGNLARLYLSTGEFEKAAEHASLEPVTWVREMLVIILDSEGHNSDALQAAAKAYEEQYGEANSYQLAEIYGYVGDLDNTFK